MVTPGGTSCLACIHTCTDLDVIKSNIPFSCSGDKVSVGQESQLACITELYPSQKRKAHAPGSEPHIDSAFYQKGLSTKCLFALNAFYGCWVATEGYVKYNLCAGAS